MLADEKDSDKQNTSVSVKTASSSLGVQLHLRPIVLCLG